MTIIIVTSTADQGTGSLREAIATAKDGDTIRFAKNLTQKTITLTSGQLILNTSINIDGRNAPGLTISGNKSTRVFLIERNTEVTLNTLRIADGKANTDGTKNKAGGGIHARQGSSLTLVNTQIENNVSELGGGLRLGHLAKATIIDSQFNGNDGTLTDKKAGFSAGAISTDSRAELIIQGTTFSNNKGFNGGAIYAYSTTKFEIEDSIFENNTAQNRAGGGAIFTDGINPFGPQDLSAGGTLRIHNSRFEGNQTDGGGGALFLYGYGKDQAIVENSVFIGNTANTSTFNGIARGGAIQSNMGITIENSTFVDNTSAKQGGALWLNSKLPVEITNSTFSGNQVIGDAGGAMFLNTKSTPVNIINSTIAYNSAGRANGALWYAKGHAVTLTNSIVAFNTANKDPRQNQVGFQAFDGGGNIEFSSDRKSMRVLANSLVVDPKLAPLQEIDGTLVHPLQPNSPAIDAGIQSGAPATDQRGFQRDNSVDIGAFESGEPDPAPTPDPDPNSEPEMMGTSGKDRLDGTANKEVIRGLAGNDVINGQGGNDLIYGDEGSDTLRGGDGKDTLIGINSNNPLVGQGEVDILIGNRGTDRLVLGDELSPYYNDFDDNRTGESDYALIKSFKSQQDVIQLHGQADDYTLGVSPNGLTPGTGIYLKTPGGDELIGIVKNRYDLELNSSYFEFVKTLKP